MNDGATAHRTSYDEAISALFDLREGDLLSKHLTSLTSHHLDRESNPAA